MASCVSPAQKPIINERPSWIADSHVSGKIAGIGICGTHINGENAQRLLAIKRAIDEIALQMGVTVSNVSLISTKSGPYGESTTLESYSFQTVNGKIVKATLRAIWKDPALDELFVWMVTE
jgi:hypothetical protein